MRKTKNFLTGVLSVLLMICVVAGFSVVPATAADQIVYEFSETNHGDWGSTQGSSQNNSGLTRAYENGAVIYDCAACSESSTGFNQVQDQWKSLPTGELYFTFKNNSDSRVEVKIIRGSATLCNISVSTNSEKVIELNNEIEANFTIFIQNYNSTDCITAGEGLFEVGAIYKVDDGGTTTESTTVKEDPNVLYKFTLNNCSGAKTEAWNPTTSVYGTFNDLETEYLPNGGLKFSVTEDELPNFKQIKAQWKSVPALEDDAYIDITNNANKTIRIKIEINGYTTPDDSDLPQIPVGETKTIELGKLNGGAITLYIQDYQDWNDLLAGEDLFTVSPIYKLSDEPETTTEPVVEETTTVAEETTTVPATEEATTTIAPTTKAPTTVKPIASEAVTMNRKAKAKLKLTKFKKAIKVKISKVVKNADGYQIKIANNKKFKKAITKVTTKKTLKIGKLKAKTKYFVKVRAYETVNGQKVYGAWSKVYSKKTK